MWGSGMEESWQHDAQYLFRYTSPDSYTYMLTLDKPRGSYTNAVARESCDTACCLAHCRRPW